MMQSAPLPSAPAPSSACADADTPPATPHRTASALLPTPPGSEGPRPVLVER
jgi:hypothetical protein